MVYTLSLALQIARVRHIKYFKPPKVGSTLGETGDESGCMSGIQALKRDRFQYVKRIAHPGKHMLKAKLVWSVRNSKLFSKRTHVLVDSFEPALSVAPLSGNKASLLYTQCMPAVLSVGSGFVRAALLWVKRSFFRDTRSSPSVSHHSYEWDPVSLLLHGGTCSAR